MRRSRDDTAAAALVWAITKANDGLEPYIGRPPRDMPTWSPRCHQSFADTPALDQLRPGERAAVRNELLRRVEEALAPIEADLYRCIELDLRRRRPRAALPGWRLAPTGPRAS